MMVCPTGGIAVTGRRLSPQDLVDLPPEEVRATPEQVEALFLSRRSVRKFQEDEVPREVLDRVVAAAATAPMGIPPWDVGVVVFWGRDKVRELAKDTAQLYAGMLKYGDNAAASILLRPFLKRATYEQFRSFILPLGRKIVGEAKVGRDAVLHDAPAALLFHASPYADAADAFIPCTHAMIAAHALGLGTTMIGCLAPPLARNKDLLRKYGIPEGHQPKIALILGYGASHFRRAIRRPFHSVRYYGEGNQG
jgi:nitroreductase